MTFRFGWLFVCAALAASSAFAAPSDLAEPFEQPPVTTEAGDLRYGDFIFWRNRNPNGIAQSFQRGGKRRGALRLGVGPGLYGMALAGDADRCDRAELREAPERQLSYGTPVWYGFSLRLPSEAQGDGRRLVVAQVKSPASHLRDPSPIFALRIVNGELQATIEFERKGADGLIRPRLGGACPAGWSPAYLHRGGQVRVSVATGRRDPGAPTRYAHCTNAISIETLAALPQAADRWVDLVVHLAAGPAGGGRLAIYADGRLVARAEGRIGHRMEGGRQFFKIGPYRDRTTTRMAVDIDDLRRGTSLKAVARRRALPN